MIACGPLIDDVESGTGRICQGDGRIGMWYAFNDGYFNLVQWPAPTPGVPIPTSDIPGGRGASKRAMRTYGGAPGAWGAGLGIDLSFDGTTYGTYDARAWDGVTFWARTATNLSHMAVRISSVPTTSVKYGGTCTNEISTPATSCNPYAEDVPLSSDWTQYWVAFPHDGRPDFTQDRLTNIQFLAPPGYDYDLWIDDVSFFAGRAGCCPSPPRGCSGSVTFPDAAVEQAVRKATTRSTGDLRCADLCSMVSLSFAEPPSGGDLHGLECVINLTDLRINYSVYGGTAPDPQPTISDLTPLTGLTRLTTLYLSYNAIADLRPLAGLTNLTSLDLRGNQIVDITALAPLTGLTHLDIGQNHIRDVSALTRMTGLYDIALDHNEISQGLEALSRYTSVNLASNQVSDLSPFARFPNLGALYLNDNRVTDLGPLAGYATLGVLDVSYNAISDLGPVATMTGLGVLQAAHNRIADLPPLARSAAPFTLDVSGNLVRDLTPLAGLPRYSTIDARDNLITDLAPLTAVPQLFITAAGNPIDCKSQLPVLDKLAADGDTLDFPVVLSGATGQTPPTCP
jgi:Leucine-rich repeat (LRR) protein